jgi:putative NADH-flavin reductase
MKVTVFGATGRTGRLIMTELAAAGHSVYAAGRRDPKLAGVAFVAVDLSDLQAVMRATEGSEAVISALASAKGNPACSKLARALAGQTGLRFVTIGGAGVDAPGDAKGIPDKLAGWVMRRVVPDMLADRQAELAILQSSRLRWTMIRPPRLTDGLARGTYRVSFERPLSTAIARGDLARACVAALQEENWSERAPFISA